MDTESKMSLFLTKTAKEDMTLIVEGKKMHVIKGILALHSPVLENMLCVEKYCPETPGEITLEGDIYEDWLEFLEFLYPTTNIGKLVTSDNVEKLLPLSDKYQVDFLKEKCRQFLTESTNKETPFEELMKTIQLADRYHLKDLVAHCTKHAKSKKPSEMLKRKADDLEGMLLRRAVKRLETELDKSINDVNRLQTENRHLEAVIIDDPGEIPEPYIEECPTCGRP